MKEKYISYAALVYKIGDLVADPVTDTLGIIFEVKKTIDRPNALAYGYRIQWQDPVLNRYQKYWDHYEICLIPNQKPNGNREI